jgi:hypothetical protein
MLMQTIRNFSGPPPSSGHEAPEGIPQEEFDKMIESTKRFQQCMALGKYGAA